MPIPREKDFGVRLQVVGDFLVYTVVRVLFCIVQAMCLESCLPAVRFLGWLFHQGLGIRRDVVEENIRHAYPQLTSADRHRLARAKWEHLFLMVVEIAHARRKIHRTNWHKYFTIANPRPLVRRLVGKRPVVLVAGHFGNFELSGYMLGMFGFPTVTVARTLDNRFIDKFLNDFRGATGQYMVPKEGSAGKIDTYLERGATLALLGDQAAGPKGCWIQFFNRPASSHKAIAVFSLANQGPLAVTFARRLGKPLQYETGMAALADPLDSEYKDHLDSIPALTQWYSERLEAVVNLAPEQYWWLHRRWKGAPPVRRKKQAA